MCKCFTIITFFLCIGQVNAHESVDGQVFISLASMTYQTQNEDAPVQGSAGLIVNGDLGESGSLEVGAFYLDKTFYREQFGFDLAEKSRRIYMTLGYRYWMTQKFSFALASFTSYSMGDPKRIGSSTGGDPGFKTSAHDTSDHGADISLAYEVYQKEEDYVVVDLRYSNSFSARDNEDGGHAAVLVAYKKQTK